MGAWAYSVDLRERVVRAFEVGEMTDHEVAALFGIGEATVHRWKRRRRETGSLDPLPHKSGNPPRVTPEQWQLGAADRERGARPDDPGGRGGVLAALGDKGELLGDGAYAAPARPDEKKKSLTATEQAEPRIQELRRRFIELAKKLDPRRLVFIDEAGSHIAMTREYARAPRGERAVGSVPRNAGTVTTPNVRRLTEGKVVRVAPKMGRKALPVESPTARSDVRRGLRRDPCEPRRDGRGVPD